MDNKQNKSLLVILIVLGVIILGLVVSIVVINVINNQAGEEVMELVMDGEATVEQVNQYIAEMDKKIDRANSPQEKAELYSERADYIVNYAIEWDNAELKDKTLSDVYKAEELNPTAMTAYNVSYYEGLFGDETKSKQYYEIAEKRGLNEEIKDTGK